MQEKRALVISGGGAKGAWGGGVLQYMIEELKYDWDLYIGSSTGSLLITLSALKEMEKLKKSYTSVNNDNIFSINPFNKNGKIDILNALYRIVLKKTSLGESSKLKTLLKKMFTISDFYKILNLNKTLCTCITNYRTGLVEFKDNFSTTYRDYIDYTIASASIPLAMDFVKKYGELYLDGGVMEHVPLQKAIDEGANLIDVIILRPEFYNNDDWCPNNIFDVMVRTIDLMQREISLSDVLVGKLKSKQKDIKINYYYTPYKLTNNLNLHFDEKQMSKWWEEGYEYIKQNGPNKSYIINNTGFRNITV